MTTTPDGLDTGLDPADVTALAAELRGYHPVCMTIAPFEALQLVGQLQLALRHPQNTGGSAAWARAFVEKLALDFGPRFRALVEAGWSL
jgi:hypothetical protein